MDQWYCKSFEQGPRTFVALGGLRELGLGLRGIPKHELFYKVVLNAETGNTCVFVVPGHTEIAQAFGAQPCEPPVFDAPLFDVTVLPVPCQFKHAHSPTCRLLF